MFWRCPVASLANTSRRPQRRICPRHSRSDPLIHKHFPRHFGCGPLRLRAAHHRNTTTQTRWEKRCQPGLASLRVPQGRAGWHGLQLSARWLGEALQHLVYVGAGSVLSRSCCLLPKVPTCCADVSGPRAPYLRTWCLLSVDVGLIHLCHRRASRDDRPTTTPSCRPGSCWREALVGAVLPVRWPMAAHRGGHRRAGGDTVVRRPDRRCQGFPKGRGRWYRLMLVIAEPSRQTSGTRDQCHCLIAAATARWWRWA